MEIGHDILKIFALLIQVQSYDASTSTVHVGALDYGVYFDVPRDDIKPILSDLAEQNSIPYRVSNQKFALLSKRNSSC